MPPPGPRDLTVVGIGASAGGLDACRQLLSALPAGNGMAFILVQHLDPTHESMMVDLLASGTAMPVRQAADGMPVERDHFYVIPPGTYLSISKGVLHLCAPQAPRGSRLPFDFLLHSLAAECCTRAVCVVLSGTGADGSLGLKSIKEQWGFVIAQDPDEAAFDGMPRSAIMTGAVDLVLPLAKIPNALIAYDRRITLTQAQGGEAGQDAANDCLPRIIDLLRAKTGHDFALYKPGTLERRIGRRMAMSAVETDEMEGYLDILRSDAAELDLLARELLIHVTSFFRDSEVFCLLAEQIVSDLVRRHPPDQPLRVWVAGCSTGEETYSLAMLFREEIAAAKSNIKLQVFASDVDPDAIATGCEGSYPATIEAEVSPERLARFFSKEGQHYRVLPELRAAVVFTVHDLLADPPFSRLDLVSCRNLLIYLRPEAQAKIISLFHFALRDGGILLLGNSETIGVADGRFEAISRSDRLYRRIGRSRPGEGEFLANLGGGIRADARPALAPVPSRQAALAEQCQRLVLDAYAPAAVLINHQNQCLYTLGPIERYLRVPPGHATHDLLAMARQGLRGRLASAIRQASDASARVVIPGSRMNENGQPVSFSLDVQPMQRDGEELLLVCFVDPKTPPPVAAPPATAQEAPRVAELERELETTRTELQVAIRDFEVAVEEQKVINEEALSGNEEYQSTNEELLTSKEELQSLNEELAALNSQLQETLERQRTTSNDLQNILYSTDVATLFLDSSFYIRFFTPATKSLFNVIPSDIGRPLADLSSLAADGALLNDAQTVLTTLVPLEREVEAQNGAWYIRRILPYHTQDNGVEGVVITFVDITERRHTADALETAKGQAEQASTVKSRFLAAASHDLRQPLQTLTLLQGQLDKTVEGDKANRLVARFEKTLGAMSGMLNTLLDINQIEASAVRAELVRFPINELLERLRDEFTYHAQANGLALRVVPCGLSVRSDPRLLEQILRNLLSNALKYTRQGSVLLGCRRHDGMLNVEVWDTGVGIPDDELQSIFEEYYQVDNPARERSHGLGLGLSIVQRLANLLGHRVRVRSRPGKGTVFAIEVALPPDEATPQPGSPPRDVVDQTIAAAHLTGAILVIEDDPEVSDILELLLKDGGHRTVIAPDGVAALELVENGTFRPNLVLADYNLPNGLNGVQVTAELRARLQRDIPVIILTGDISTATLRDIALQHCLHLNKPVRLKELTEAIQRLLARSPEAVGAPIPVSVQAPIPGSGQPPGEAPAKTPLPVVHVVDDDGDVREALRSVLEDAGLTVQAYPSGEAFLAAYRPGGEACVVLDGYLPGMSGLEVLRRLHDAGHLLPVIMITGSSDVSMAVQAMKAGAADFIEKPVRRSELLTSIQHALDQIRDSSLLAARRENAGQVVAGLTPRQRQIMDMVLAGFPSKNIAADLGISQRTVENHRAAIMKKTAVKSLPALARLAMAAVGNGVDGSVSQRPPAVGVAT